MKDSNLEITLGILKSIYEYGNGGRNLGSTLSLNHYLEEMKDCNWLDNEYRLTEFGRKIYEVGDLDKIKSGRYYMFLRDYGESIKKLKEQSFI